MSEQITVVGLGKVGRNFKQHAVIVTETIGKDRHRTHSPNMVALCGCVCHERRVYNQFVESVIRAVFTDPVCSECWDIAAQAVADESYEKERSA